MPTPNPTSSDIIMRMGTRDGGRVTAAWNEVLRIFADVLPGVIARANETCVDYKGQSINLPDIEGFYVDGEEKDAVFPCVTVGASVRSEPQAPESNSDFIDMTAHVMVRKPFDRRAMDTAADMVGLLAGILWHYQCAHVGADGNLLWSGLQLSAITRGPKDANNYGGFSLHFRLTQFPGEGMWGEGEQTASADPTPDEVLDALRFCGGRLSVVWNELLEILASHLPGAVALTNSTYGLALPGDDRGAIQFRALGEELDVQFPAIVADCNLHFEPETFRLYAGRATFSVFLLAPRAGQRRSVDDPTDLSNVLRAVLSCYFEGYTNDRGWRVWNEMEEGEQDLTPAADSKNYGVYALTVQASIDSNSEMWRAGA